MVKLVLLPIIKIISVKFENSVLEFVSYRADQPQDAQTGRRYANNLSDPIARIIRKSDFMVGLAHMDIELSQRHKSQPIS